MGLYEQDNTKQSMGIFQNMGVYLITVMEDMTNF